MNSHGQRYDYNSIMHYGKYAFSRNGQPTIVARNARQTFGQRNGLSDGDKIQARRMYGCDDTTKPGPGPGTLNFSIFFSFTILIKHFSLKLVGCKDTPKFATWCKETKKMGLCKKECLQDTIKEHCCGTCIGNSCDN